MIRVLILGLVASQAWAGPLLVHDAVPVRSGPLREALCRVLLAAQGNPNLQSGSLTVIARSELYPDLDEVKRQARFQHDASRKPADTRKVFSEDIFRTVARGLHEARIDHGYDSYPFNAESPYLLVEEVVFGVQSGDREFPVRFFRLPDDGTDSSFWSWRIDEPISVSTKLTHAREISPGVDPIAAAEIPAPVLTKIRSYDLERELTGEIHQKHFDQLAYAEGSGRAHFDPGKPSFYSVRDPKPGNSLGYLVTQDLTITWDFADASDAFRNHFSDFSSVDDIQRRKLYRRYAYFDLKGNRVDAVIAPYEGDLQGRLVTDEEDIARVQHPTDAAKIVELVSDKSVGRLRDRQVSTQLQLSLQPPKASDDFSQLKKRWLEAAAGTVFVPFQADPSADYLPRALLSPDARYVLPAGSDGSVYDSATGKVVGNIVFAGLQNGLFSVSTNRLYLANSNGVIEILDPANGGHLGRILLEDRFGNAVSGEPQAIGEFGNGMLYVHVARGGNDDLTSIVNPKAKQALPLLRKAKVVGAQGNTLQITRGEGIGTDSPPFGIELERIDLSAEGVVRKLSVRQLPAREKKPHAPGYFERYNFESTKPGPDGVTYVLAQSYGRTDFRFFRVQNAKAHRVKLPEGTKSLSAAAFFPRSPLLATSSQGGITLWKLSAEGMVEAIRTFPLPVDFVVSDLEVSEHEDALLYRNEAGAVGVIRAH